jgi:hypothetical protein
MWNVFNLWSSGSWLQIQMSSVRFPAHQIFWEVVQWGPLSLVGTTEELLGRNSSGFSTETREHGRGYPWGPLKNLSGGLSVGIVRSRTKATEISFIIYYLTYPALPGYLFIPLFYQTNIYIYVYYIIYKILIHTYRHMCTRFGWNRSRRSTVTCTWCYLSPNSVLTGDTEM